jgi:hypothetical protein
MCGINLKVALLISLSTMTLQGCALKYIDKEGAQRIIGLVNMKIEEAQPDATFAGHVVDMQVLGLGVSQNAAGINFTLGYGREISGYLRDDVQVFGDPLAIRASKNDEEPSK